MRARALTAFFLSTALSYAPHASAAHPSTRECLAASDGSLQANSLSAEKAQLLLCSSPGCPAEIRQECVSRLTEVTAKMPSVRFTVTDPGGHELTVVKITIDGKLAASRTDTKPIELDPGDHLVVLEAPGQPSFNETLTLREGEKNRREVVHLGPPPPPPAPLPVPLPIPVVPAAPPPPPAPPKAPFVPGESSGPLPGQKVAALVAGGIGVAGAAVGVAFGLVALSKKSDAEGLCPNSTCPTQAGVDAWSSAHGAGTAATVGFVVAGVGAATGVILWITAPSSKAGSARVGVGPRGVAIAGSF